MQAKVGIHLISDVQGHQLISFLSKGTDDAGVVISVDETSTTEPAVKKRGRTVKPKAVVTEAIADAPSIPKKRGRPLKSKTQTAPQDLPPSAENAPDVVFETNKHLVTPTEDTVGSSQDGPLQKRPRIDADQSAFTPPLSGDPGPPYADTNLQQDAPELQSRADSPMEVDHHSTNISTNLIDLTLTNAPELELYLITEPPDFSNPDPNHHTNGLIQQDDSISVPTSMSQNPDGISAHVSPKYQLHQCTTNLKTLIRSGVLKFIPQNLTQFPLQVQCPSPNPLLLRSLRLHRLSLDLLDQKHLVHA